MAWYRSTTATSGITTFDTVANALAVLNTFFTACAAEGASFLWTVASYQSSAPRYLVLKRKDGSAGRLMFFGGTTPHVNAIWTLANTSTLYVGYDRTATTDTPSTAYDTGRPWGGSLANWCPGRPFSGLSAAASNLRAYCNSSCDTLAVFWMPDAQTATWGSVIVGNWLRNQAGTACLGMQTFGTGTATNFIFSIAAGSNAFATTFTAGSAMVQAYDATMNEFVMLFANVTNSLGNTQVVQNERFISPSGYAIFYPTTLVVAQGGSVPENRLYTTRYMGHGPMKTMNFQWTDNAASPKGYYIGYNTTTSDVSAFSLLDDTF